MTDREKKLEAIIEKLIQPIKGIPFEIVVKSLCAVDVLPFDKTNAEHQSLLDKIANAMRKVCKAAHDQPICRLRPNDVGNDIESFVIDALQSVGLQSAKPKTLNGKGKTTGYPDVRIETADGPVFLEVKTFAAANHETTQRSFYISPTDDPKVHDDGLHLLVGFEVNRYQNKYLPVAFTIVDLYGLDCDIKFEFNSDNKRLYAANRVIYSERMV